VDLFPGKVNALDLLTQGKFETGVINKAGAEKGGNMLHHAATCSHPSLRSEYQTPWGYIELYMHLQSLHFHSTSNAMLHKMHHLQ